MGPNPDDAALVLAVRGGDQVAFAALFERWSDRCYDVARRILHDDGRAAEVAQDVLLRAWQQLDTLQDPGAFGGWVLRMARNRALDRLGHEQRATPVEGDAPVFVDRAGDEGADVSATDALTAADHRELLDAAQAVLGERESSVLDLHLRHGLGAAELADELGVTANNAHQLIFRMKKKLSAGIRAWVLVRGGRVRCPELAGALAAAGIDGFSREAATVIDRHVGDCDDCTRRQAALLDPSALFAAAPLLVMSDQLRATVMGGLQAAGVPVEPTGAAAPDPTQPLDGEPQLEPAPDPDPDPAGPNEPPPGAEPIEVSNLQRRRRRRLGVAAAAVILVAAGAAAVLRPDDSDDVATVAPTSTTTIDDGTGEDAHGNDGETTTVAGGPTTTIADEGSTTTSVVPLPGPGATTTTAAPAPDATDAPPLSMTPNPPGTPTTTVAPRPPTTPTSTAPPTTATTTTTRPAPPRVLSFTATPAASPGGSCSPSQWATTLVWRTTGATEVEIEATTVGTLDGLATTGTQRLCRATPGAPPGGWTLRATGPGGSTSASA